MYRWSLLALVLGACRKDDFDGKADTGPSAVQDSGASAEGGEGGSDGAADGGAEGATDGGADGSADGGADGAADGGGDSGGAETGADTGSGGGADGADGGGDGGGGDGGESPVDYRLAGDLAYTSVEASLTTSGGCDLSYVWTEVDGVADAPLVILAHGFMRGPEQMADLGQHLATWGLSSAAVDLCHSSTFDIDPEANALDMVELADHLTGSGPRAYLGHSNGGMAALIAASFDERAVTVVGLDPVEAFGSDSAEFGAEVSVPGAALLGEPGLCNSDNSGAAAYGEISSSRALRVTEADHCDFEFPTDGLCTFGCWGTNELYSDDEIHSAILGLSTAWLVWQLSGEAAGEDWWTAGGFWYELLLDDGAISEP